MTLFAFLMLHIGGALYHQVILRDNLLARMSFICPWKRQHAEATQAAAETGNTIGG
jgi:TRAP-type uncharacterized transport system fused permease subunit